MAKRNIATKTGYQNFNDNVKNLGKRDNVKLYKNIHKVTEHSRKRPQASLFDSYYIEV